MQTEKWTVWRRIRSYPIAKSLGSVISISLFFMAYFFVLEHPSFTPRTMPAFALDAQIPVLPWSAWVYFSLWFFICTPLALMMDRSVMLYYLYGSLTLSIIGLCIFYLYPTMVPAWDIDWSLYPTLEFLKNSDNAGNACPSLHVGFATFSGGWLVWLVRRIGLSPLWAVLATLWGVLIVLSTLTTKQHVLIDVIFGFILGAFVFWMNAMVVKRAQLAL